MIDLMQKQQINDRFSILKSQINENKKQYLEYEQDKNIDLADGLS
jgi:hypothetical protein